MKKIKQESETSTFGTKQFKNVFTGDIQTPIVNDYSLTGGISLHVSNEFKGNPVIEKEEVFPDMYIKVTGNPEEEGRYFTKYGFLFYKNNKWIDSNKMGYNGITHYYKAAELTTNEFIYSENLL